MYVEYDIQTAGDAAENLKNILFEDPDRMPPEDNGKLRFRGFPGLTFDCPYDLSSECSVRLLGGRPGMGKTSFALQAALARASKGKEVYFFSPIHSPIDLILKALAQAEVTDSRQPEKHVFDNREERAIKTALSKIGRLNVCFVTGKHTIAERVLKGVPTGAFVIVDGLNRFYDERTDPEEYASLENALLCHASPLLITTGVDRTVDKRKDRRPKPTDLICGSLMYAAADCILTLYRPGYYNNDGDPSALVTSHYPCDGSTEKELKNADGERQVVLLPAFEPGAACRLSFDRLHGVFK